MKYPKENHKTTNPEFISSRFIQVIVFLGILSIVSSCKPGSDNEKRLPFVLKVSVNDSSDQGYFILNWKMAEQRLGSVILEHADIMIKDLNNDEILIPDVIDTDNDHSPDYLRVRTLLSNEEPLRPFELIVREIPKSRLLLKHDSVPASNEVSIEFLNKSDTRTLTSYYENSWAKAISETVLTTYTDPAHLEIFAPTEWTYSNGFFLNGLCYFDEITGEEKYLDYVRQWMDLFVRDDGSMDTVKYNRQKYRLDDVLPGRSLLYLYEKTKDEKYLKAAEELLGQIKHQPRTSEGGYWHKKIYEWQMWLDGIYMSDVFMLQYASLLNKPQYYDEAIFQMKLIYKHTLDTVTGLLYHGWDESKSAIWANPATGRSPEFWGRGMGWYMMALVDALDYIPESHPGRGDILDMLKQVSGSIMKYQDQETGLWYQVIDKADKDGNWPETSCTAMFAYSFLKAYKKGYLPVLFKNSAYKAYEGLKKGYIYFDDSGKLYLTGTVKVGTLNVEVSNGSFEYYVSVDRRVNDFKGIGALLYLAIADEYLENLNTENDGL